MFGKNKETQCFIPVEDGVLVMDQATYDYIRKLRQQLTDEKEQHAKDVEFYKESIRCLEDDIATLTKYNDETPEDCVKGAWCTACVFSKTYFVKHLMRSGPNYFSNVLVCEKGKTCKNFVQYKEEKNAEN